MLIFIGYPEEDTVVSKHGGCLNINNNNFMRLFRFGTEALDVLLLSYQLHQL